MLALFLVIPLALDPLPAPEAHFVLKGTVLDTSRAPLVAALVSIAGLDQRISPTTQSDEKGEFSLLLAPGTYTVRVTAPGFLAAERTVAALESGGDAREFVLKVA